MASTYQRISGGRLLVNIVTGAEPAELARFGVWEDKETRYERTGEFVEIMRGAWSGTPFEASMNLGSGMEMTYRGTAWMDRFDAGMRHDMVKLQGVLNEAAKKSGVDVSDKLNFITKQGLTGNEGVLSVPNRPPRP